MTRPTRLRPAYACIALTVALTIAGCGAPANSVSKKPNAGTHAITNVTVVGTPLIPPSAAVSQPAALTTGGIALKNGLKITEIDPGSSTLATAALESGQAQFIVSNLSTMAAADAQGAGIVMPCGFSTSQPGVIVSGPSITKVTQLNGKTIAIQAQGTTTQFTPVAYFQATGAANPSTFTYATTGSISADAQYLAAGKVDFIWEPAYLLPTLLAQDPQVHVLVTAAQLQKAVPQYGGGIQVKRSYYRAHTSVVDEMCKAVIEASRAIYDSKSYYEHLINIGDPGLYSAQQLTSLYSIYQPPLAVNGGLSAGVLAGNFTLWAAYVDPSAAINHYFKSFSELVLTQPVTKALRSLGVYPKVDQPTLLSAAVRKTFSASKGH